MNMNSNIKYGVSSNGMVLTDMPINQLKAMRDAIDNAIKQHQKSKIDRLTTDIHVAIDAAKDAGYDVHIDFYNGDYEIILLPAEDDEEEEWGDSYNGLYDDDFGEDDDEDEDEDEDW